MISLNCQMFLILFQILKTNIKTCNIEFDEIIVRFRDQNGRPLEIESKVAY